MASVLKNIPECNYCTLKTLVDHLLRYAGVKFLKLLIVRHVNCPFKNVWKKIAVLLKSNGESEIACN